MKYELKYSSLAGQIKRLVNVLSSAIPASVYIHSVLYNIFDIGAYGDHRRTNMKYVRVCTFNLYAFETLGNSKDGVQF